MKVYSVPSALAKFYYSFQPSVTILLLLLVTFGCISCNFVFLVHCHLLEVITYLPYNDTIISQLAQSINITSWQNMYIIN